MQLLGLREPRRGERVVVERGALVRVLAVAQVGELGRRNGVEVGERLVPGLLGEPGRDGRVVGRQVREGLGGEAEPLLGGGAARVRGGADPLVVGRVDHDRDVGVVLGGAADHRGPADVDLLDDVVEAGAGGDGLGEGVEVPDEQVEGLDVELGELLAVRALADVGEEPGVDLRVEGLDAVVEDLWEAGEVFDLGHRDAGLADAGRGRAGGDELDACGVEVCGQFDDAGLVEDRDEGSPDGFGLRGHGCVTHGMLLLDR